MELKTFGEGLQFGMELETACQRAYERVAQAGLDSELQETITSFAQACRKRRTYLESLFKESIYSDMDTGVFQPIGSLDGTRYGENWDEIPVSAEALEKAIRAEEKVRLFYSDFAVQIKSQRNAVAMRFRKMAEENADRASKLKEWKSA